MADVRALLAAERQSRRITHPHLTYSKSGALTCNICNLNIKSEQLWPGHLKSLNHRKNVQRISSENTTTTTRPTKRKIERVDEDDNESLEREHDIDSRKKPRSASQTPKQTSDTVHTIPAPPVLVVTESPEGPPPATSVVTEEPVVQEVKTTISSQESRPDKVVDEDEWAAFERDVAVLAQPSYDASMTIEAAPITTAELAEQQRKSNGVQLREEEAEAEKEEESRRLEEEFDVMEEMEERVKRLRERREALRAGDLKSERSIPVNEEYGQEDDQDDPQQTHRSEEDEESGDDQIDDWYG